MTNRPLLLASAAMLIPATPTFAQQQPAPTTASPASAAPTQPEPSAAPTSGGAAPAADAPDEFGEDEAPIVIKGAKPRGSVVGDIPPENTLDSRDVRATGATNINELLDAIAPQIGSVQGRGAGRPVLLLNGQRISSFRELRDIPTEAIERVEILPEEVALKYGYRADQKVVNIVLRQRFRSTTAQVGIGTATEGHYVSGNGDLTRLLIQRNGRTTFNLHAEGNTMLTEAERNILLTEAPSTGATADQELAARSLVGTRHDLRGSTTINRNLSTNVSGTVNAELEHTDGRSLIGLNPSLLEPLARNTATDTAHLGLAANGQTKSQWHWTVTSNADLAGVSTRTDREDPLFPRGRTHETTFSADLTATANGKLFKLPAGDATTTLTAGGNTNHLRSTRTDQSGSASNSLSRTTELAGVNIDVPISRRGRAFSALGNLTLNGNAEVDHLSDFGTLTKFGAGLNFSPVERLNLLTSWTREEGPPTINQLGDPVLTTPNSRVFDFVTGQTVLVTAITGGNPNLNSDRRTVIKLSGNWQPFQNTDLRFRADYVHQKIERPISDLSVTTAIEQAFPGRFVRCPIPSESDPNPPDCTPGQLTTVDLRPVNFDSSRRDQLRIGFDFTKPLKSRRPSQAVIDQMRAQFGFGGRGGGERRGANTGAGGTQPSPQAGAATTTTGTTTAQNGAPTSGSAPEAGRGGGFGGGGRGFGGRGGGGGFFGGAGGNQSRGRLNLSVTDTITFVDKVVVAPGGPVLDYLHGDPTGASGGTPRHNVQAQLGWFNNGLGARLGANWRSGTTVNSLTGDNLHFSSYGTFDLRLFANPGDIPEVVVKHPWLRGTQVRFEVTNIFNARPAVHDAAGNVPLNYQPDLLDPLGRTIMISFRKLFLPSPATFRRLFQQERARQQGTAP
jgi:hypothetical protein